MKVKNCKQCGETKNMIKNEQGVNHVRWRVCFECQPTLTVDYGDYAACDTDDDASGFAPKGQKYAS